MTPSLFPPPGRLRAMFQLMLPLASAAALAMMSAAAFAVESPWMVNPWRYHFEIPAGNYTGPRNIVVSAAKTTQVSWQTGSQIVDLDARFDSAAGMQATGCLFRKVKVGLSLKGALELKDCVLDTCTFNKINPWYDKKDPATRWQFSNCVFARSFMGKEITVQDCAVKAVNCTFVDLSLPAVQYRDGDVVSQAQQDGMKFEKCRFVNCEVGERFLAATTDCVFSKCHFTGPDEKFAGEVKKPLEAKVWWAEEPYPASRSAGNFRLTVVPGDSPLHPGSSQEYTNKDGLLTMGALPPQGPLVTLATQGPASILTDATKPGDGATPLDPANPAAPGDPAKPAGSSPPSPNAPAILASQADPTVVSGTAGAPAVPLPKTRSSINALLVVELPGQGVAGSAAKLSALALPIDPQASMEVKFNQKVGPQMQAALSEVVKCLQVRHKGWPRGHRVELAFEDKFEPKDGPSAAVACALLLDSMIGNWEIDPAIAVTGDLNADGSVQPIGGVSGKIRGATKAGCLRVALPIKNARSVGDVLLTEGVETLAKIEIFSIATLDSAIALVRRPAAAPAAAAAGAAAPPAGASATTAAQLFQEVRRSLMPGNKWNAAGLRDRTVMAKLQEIFRQQPNDLSAGYLMAVANNTAPVKLTLRGSIETMDQVAEALVIAIKNKELANIPKIGNDTLGDSVYKLRRIRPRMDSRVLPSVDSLTKFGEVLRNIQSQPPRTQAKLNDQINEVKSTAAEAVRQRDLLMKTPEVVEELMK